MADSEVRQKFEAWSDEYARQDKPATAPPKWIAWDAWKEAYSLGMRAGEIAMREKAVKVARDEGDTPREDGGNFARRDACDNVARMIRALPAAPEEKKS